MPEEKGKIIELQTTIDELQGRMALTSKENAKLKEEIARLKTVNFTLSKAKELLTKENEDLKKQVINLEKDKEVLQKQIQRPKMSAEDLMVSLKDAIVGMEAGLKSEKARVDYSVGKFDVDLKTNVFLDKERKLFIQMPFLGETVPSENLSVFKLSINAVPKPKVPLITVPNVIGRMKDSAVEAINMVGLKASLTEKPSPSPKDMVIAQDPEAYSEVPPETNVVLVIAKPQTVKIPNLIGMEKDVAIKTLGSSELIPGKVEEKVSDAEPGIVISQNPQPASVAKIGSVVDMVISTRGIKVPNLIGKTGKEARALIKHSNLSVGTVSYSASFFHEITLAQTPGSVVSVPPQTPVDIKVGRKISLNDMKQLISSFPETRKFGITAKVVFLAIDNFEISTRKRLDEFIELPDKTIQDRLKLKNLKMAKGLKEVLKKTVKELDDL